MVLQIIYILRKVTHIQCDIFKQNKYSIYLVVCEVSKPSYPNATKIMNARGMMGEMGLR